MSDSGLSSFNRFHITQLEGDTRSARSRDTEPVSETKYLYFFVRKVVCCYVEWRELLTRHELLEPIIAGPAKF